MKLKIRLFSILLAGLMTLQASPSLVMATELPDPLPPTIEETVSPDLEEPTDNPEASQPAPEPEPEPLAPLISATETMDTQETPPEDPEEDPAEEALETTDGLRLVYLKDNDSLSLYFEPFGEGPYTARLVQMNDPAAVEEVASWEWTDLTPDAETGICAQSISLKDAENASLLAEDCFYQLQLSSGETTVVQNFTSRGIVRQVTAAPAGETLKISWEAELSAEEEAPLYGFTVSLYLNGDVFHPVATTEVSADARTEVLAFAAPEDWYTVAVTPIFAVTPEEEAPLSAAETVSVLTAKVVVPTEISAAAGDAQATITFRPVSNATHYNIYRNGTRIKQLAAADLTASEENPELVCYTDKTALNNVSYTYQVQAGIEIPDNADGAPAIVTGMVSNTTTLNLRQGPSTSSAVVGTLKKGDYVTILGEEGDFYQIDGGYVSKIRITVQSPGASARIGVVSNTTVLNVRQAPSTSSSVVGTLKKGDYVTILGEEGDFYQIDGGYVSKIRITVQSVDASVRVGTVVNTTVLNVRQGPSTSSAVVSTLKKGATVLILGEEGDFYRIEGGYVSKIRISVQGAAPAEPNLITSELSEKTAAVTPKIVTPGDITNLTTAIGNKAIALSWDASENADYYKVYRYNSSTKKYVAYAKVTTNYYRNTGLTAGTTYYYKVQAAHSSGGVIAYSNLSGAVSTKAYTMPTKVTNLKATAKDASVTLTWSKNTNASGYRVYLYDPETKKKTTVADTTSLTYTVADLQNDTKYYFVVCAYRTISGVKKLTDLASDPVSATPKILIPAAPTDFKAANADERVKLTWVKGTNALQYEIYRKADGEEEYALLTKTTAVSYIDDNLPNGSTYQYQIRSVRSSGGQTVYSAYVESTAVTTAPLPASAPTSVQLTQTKTTNTLSWTAGRKAEFYRVYLYNSSTGKYDTLLADDLTECTFTHTIDASSTTYFKYKIVSCRTLDGTVTESVTGASKNCYALAYVEKIQSVRTIHYSIKVSSKAPYFSSSTSSTQLGTLAVGTRATELMRAGGRSKLQLSNGNIVWITTTRLTRLSSNYSAKTTYSSSISEAWVNYQGYSSPTSYLLWISQYTQKVYIFKGSAGNWKQVKCFVIGTGKTSTPTPMVTRAVWGKDRGWYSTWTYEIYCTKWFSLNAFHSRVKSKGGGYADSRIGMTISNGCCRMYDSDCKWIYDNIPLQSTVVSF